MKKEMEIIVEYVPQIKVKDTSAEVIKTIPVKIPITAATRIVIA